MPRLRDIVAEALADGPAADLITCSLDELRHGAGVECDVLVTEAVGGEEDDYARTLLNRVPAARLLLITRRGDRATVYDLVPHKQVLDEVSPAELATAIRSATRFDAQ